MAHLSTAELEAGLDDIRRSPQTEGTVDLLVVRAAGHQTAHRIPTCN